MALTDTKVRSIKSREKSYKIDDGRGLFLGVNPTGSKYWRLKYHFGDKEKLLSLGIYPDVTLADARRKRDDARKLLADDIDPGLAKQLKKRVKKLVAENSLESIAREWHIRFASKWTPEHGARTWQIWIFN